MAGRDARTPAGEFTRTDRVILEALQENGRLTTAELAERTAMSASPCWRRVRKLEEDGVITGYHASVDQRKLGYGVTAYILVGTETTNDRETAAFEEAILRIPEVIDCVGISGTDDYLLRVIARDLGDYYESVFDRVRRLPLVRRTQSMFAMKTVKSAKRIPLPAEE